MGGGRGCGACGGTDRWPTWFKLLLFCSCDNSGVVGMTTTWGVAANVGTSAGADVSTPAGADVVAGDMLSHVTAGADDVASAASAGADVSTPAGADVVAGDMLSHVAAGAEVATGAGANIVAGTC